MIKNYISLTKPGIIAGNLMTAIAGFFLASSGRFMPKEFFGMILGLVTIIASACVFNNYRDKDIDAKMSRTKHRSLVLGSIQVQSALRFASLLLLVSVLIFSVATSSLTLIAALCGFIMYVGVYTPLKKTSVHGTLIGSIAGAAAPVCGYLAARPSFDAGALIILSMVVLWQMPHFYAIAIYRLSDYKEASVPVLPLVKGMHATKIQMTVYSALFALVCTLPSFFGLTGYKYLVSALIMGAVWVGYSALGFTSRSDEKWAKMMFRLSLIVITVLSVMMSVDCL